VWTFLVKNECKSFLNFLIIINDDKQNMGAMTTHIMTFCITALRKLCFVVILSTDNIQDE
jgi:hypothetical protein